MPLTIIMYLLNVIVLYYFVPSIFSHNIIILTDWNRSTLQCMKQFFETTKYLTKYDTNVIISGLDKKEESVVQSKALQNFNDLTSIYHKTDYFPQQEQEEKYYSKLIRLLNSSNSELLLFADKSKLNNYFQQKHKNVKIISCKNTNCENCEDQKPHALAIVNQVPETKDIDSNEQNQSKEASDKSWSDETIIGAKGSMLELSPFSVLTGIPGETVKLYFRVMNKHWLPLEYTFHCYDQMGLIRSVLPTRILLAPNSAPFDVTVVLEVLGPEGSIDQITFSVQQPELELIKVNFYIGKPTGDTTRPTIDYIFNGDCRFADSPHNCASEKWSIEATVQDDNSGLASISSIPNNLRFRSEFSVGTREPVIVYYTSTCCYPKVEIFATDLRGNVAKKTIDAEKQYLNMAEIGLIVVSGILLFILILLLIYLIIRCQRRRRSRDFLSG